MRSARIEWSPWNDETVQTLGDGGALVFDSVLGLEAATDTFNSVLKLAADGQLRRAGIGRSGNLRQDEAIRQDLITWVDETNTNEFARVTALFEGVRAAANETCWMGLKRFDTQIALYSGDGAQYDRHRDAFHGKSSRTLTAIYYPNIHWEPAHGGQLRVFFSEDNVEDIDPVADRLVVFLSEILDHQVLPTFAPRAALTAWFYP